MLQRYHFLLAFLFLIFSGTESGLLGQIGVRNRYFSRPSLERLDYRHPKTYILDSLHVEGAVSLDEQTLLSISGLRIGQSISLPGPEMSNALKRLWKQGFMGDISAHIKKIEGQNIELVIRIKEHPRLLDFKFQGLRKTHAEEIEDELDLVKGKVITDVLLKTIERAVENYMKKKGYLSPHISLEQKQDSLLVNGARLHILVTSGPKTKIERIVFHNTDPFSKIGLKFRMKETGERPRFYLIRALPHDLWELLRHPIQWKNLFSRHPHHVYNWSPLLAYWDQRMNIFLFKSSRFKKEEYGTDKQLLIEYIQSEGYRDARILSDTIHKEGNKLYIDIQLDVGEKYYFRNIYWEGNHVYEDSLLSQILNIHKGDVYDLALLQKKLHYDPQKGDVSSLYADDGYLFFNIQPIEIAVEGDSIDVEMRMYEGPQTTIRRVFLSGNERVYDHVLLRELHTLPGQKYNRSLLIRSQQSLGQLSFVDAQNTVPVKLPDPTEQKFVDIEWRVAEKVGDQIELSAGWGGGLGLVGTVGFTLNNFSLSSLTHVEKWRPLPVGDGQQLAFHLRSNGLPFTSISTSFTEPWFGAKRPNSLSLSYSLSRERSLGPNNEITGSFTLHSAQIGLNRSLRWPDDFFSAGNSLGYKLYDLDNISTRSLGYRDGRSHNFSSRMIFSRNNVNHPIYPTSGALLSLSVELTPPYSLWRKIPEEASTQERYLWVEYHKWMADLKFYLEIVKKLVLESRAHVGYMAPYSSHSPISPFERFSLGGDGLTGQNFILGTDIIGLRGYPNNSIQPQERLEDLEGGSIFTKYVAELRYPVVQTQAATFFVLSFVEAGNSWNAFSNLSLFDLYRSTGVGVRALLPAVGFLGIDWGWRVDGRPGSFDKNNSEVHFILGKQVR
ncbi:MAG: BamA/TamA family outer membrane protein [Cytophagales bacterium]|nr:BamA/TamA family outer membrane protein [Cytophagales bacterium]